MALFRRRRDKAPEQPLEQTTAPARPQVQGPGAESSGRPEGDASAAVGGEEAQSAGLPSERATAADGPYDVAERPDLDGRLDLGSLRVRLVEGAQVSFATDKERTVVHGVTLRTADSLLFIELFAAPRTLDVWDDIRTEMREALAEQGAIAEEGTGPFGPEIIARQVVQRSDGSTERVPTRLIGIDGPRWFVRATASGALGALVGAQRRRHPLENALADLVVVRDGAPRAPRSRIDLALPTGVRLTTGQGAPAPARVQAPPSPGAGDQGGQLPDSDEVLRRGPEITEVR